MTDSNTLNTVTQVCTDSSSFSKGANGIISTLNTGAKEQIDATLKAIADILGNKDAAPTTKFWALFLLNKAVEPKNDNLAGRLARTSDLLQKIFKIAQQDYDKPYEVRGQNYFKDSPNTDKQVGVNTVTLGFELISFFKHNFGTDDAQNARQVFSGMYNTLNPKVHLPEPSAFHIIGNKNVTVNDKTPTTNWYQVQAPVQNKPVETKPVETKPVETKPVVVNKPVETKVADNKTPDILSLIKDGNGFAANLNGVLAAVARNDSAYNTEILGKLAEVINGECTPQQKFYTSYFLLKATEGKNTVFVESLAGTKPLLNKLFKDGQTDKAKELSQKGRKMFGETTELSNCGNNYMYLILETFSLWASNFTQQIYSTIHTNLKNKEIEFPKENVFVGKSYKVSNGWECQPLNGFKLESTIPATQTVYVSKAEETKPVVNTNPVPKVSTNAPAVNNTQKAQDLLKNLLEKKNAVRQYYLANRYEDKSLADLNKALIGEYAGAASAVVPQLDALSDSKVPADKALNMNIIEEINHQQHIIDAYNRWANKKSDYNTARNDILRELGEQTGGDTERSEPRVVQEPVRVVEQPKRDERPVAQSFGNKVESLPNTVEKPRNIDPFSSGIKTNSSLKDSQDQFFFRGNSIKTPDRKDNDLFRSTTLKSTDPKEDLKSIEQSIKHSYTITGKDAPQFKTPSYSITPGTRLQQERDELARQVSDLQRENDNLRNNLANAQRTIQQLQTSSPYNPLKTENSPEKTVSPLITKVGSGAPVSTFDHEPSQDRSYTDGYKPCKGVRVPENNNHIANISNNRERIAAAKAKAPVFENDFIQVGLSSSVVRDPITRRNQAKFVIFFGNKSGHDCSDLSVNYQYDEKALGVVPVPFKLDNNLRAGDQVKQTIIVTLFDARNMSLSCSGSAFDTPFNFAIPLTVLKFLDCKATTSEEFRHKWKLRDIFVLKTDEIDVDEALIKEINDFKKYFPLAEELKAGSSKKTKFGVVFDLDNPSGDYLMRINILPNSRVVFQIASYDNVQDRAATVLQTLVALFKDHSNTGY